MITVIIVVETWDKKTILRYYIHITYCMHHIHITYFIAHGKLVLAGTEQENNSPTTHKKITSRRVKKKCVCNFLYITCLIVVESHLLCDIKNHKLAQAHHYILKQIWTIEKKHNLAQAHLKQVSRFASLIQNIYFWQTPLLRTLTTLRMRVDLQPVLSEYYNDPSTLLDQRYKTNLIVIQRKNP